MLTGAMVLLFHQDYLGKGKHKIIKEKLLVSMWNTNKASNGHGQEIFVQISSLLSWYMVVNIRIIVVPENTIN